MTFFQNKLLLGCVIILSFFCFLNTVSASSLNLFPSAIGVDTSSSNGKCGDGSGKCQAILGDPEDVDCPAYWLQWVLDVMKYINQKTTEFKKEDHILYAIYGTPAENLCGLQVKQFRKKYGVIPGVSSREYVSNSFHCGVWEDITGIEKQDLEDRFWDLFRGGRIQYVRYNLSYNTKAMVTYIERAMAKGFYEGVNLSLSYCNHCGHEELDMDVCPKCGSTDLTKIERMNGYLSYSRVHGDTMLNNAKMAEISERKSM